MDAEWLRIGIDGVVPVTWTVGKSDDAGPGVVEGWASVYNVLDGQDDVVLPGAFARTINAWKASGRTIPLVLDHEHSTEGVVGSITKLQETPLGLKFAATFSSTPRAQEARTKAMEKHLAGLSIFGPIIRKSFESRDGREIRLLQELGLMEISLTPFPANDRAVVTAAKKDLDEAWVADMRAALVITSPQVRKAAVTLLIADAHSRLQETTTETPTEEATETTNPDQVDDASRYALHLIGESGPDTSPPGGNPSDSSLADLLAPLQAAGTTTELEALEAELKQMGHMA